MKVIDEKTAIGEVLQWIEFRKIPEMKISEMEEQHNKLIKMVSFGHVKILDNEIVLSLVFPLSSPSGTEISQLRFSNKRYTMANIESGLRGEKDITKSVSMLSVMVDGGNGMVSPAILKGMDPFDFSNCQIIMSFFL